MQKAATPSNERQRLHALQRYQLLDTEPEKALDDLTQLAASVFDVPICLVTLVDENRQWFKSSVGLSIQETPRDVAFCAHTILDSEPLIVSDALSDPRFADNPLVTGDPFIRFYAGAPLVVAEKMSLGTLCLIDRIPTQLSKKKLNMLNVIRDAVVAQLEIRHMEQVTGTLNNLVTLCAWCKKIKPEPDAMVPENWISADEFVRASRIITHSVCPSCQDQMLKDN